MLYRIIMYAFGHVIYVGVGAAWNIANVQATSTVAIFGLGAVGLAVSFFSFFSLRLSCSQVFWLLFSFLIDGFL